MVTLPGQASGHACIPWAIPCAALLPKIMVQSMYYVPYISLFCEETSFSEQEEDGHLSGMILFVDHLEDRTFSIYIYI